MLPEPLRLLISAFATGDVTPRQRTAALRLLRHSSEARELLRELKFNNRQLSSLPRQVLQSDFADRVLRAIPVERPIIRSTDLVRLSQPRLSRSTQFAAAATVLLAVGMGMYLSAILPTDAGNIAQGIQTVTNQSPVPADRAQISSPKRFKPDQGIDPLPSEPPTSSTQTVVQGPPAVVPMQPMATALPKPPEVLGNNPTPLPELVEILPPLLTLPFPLREFDSAGHRQALLQELSRSDIRRIDLFCRDTVRAFERFQAVSRNRGVRLLIEPVALEALRRKRASWFVVYSDGLTAADWAQLLQLLATADKQAELRRPGDGLFDQIVLLPFASAEQRDLLALSGSDLTRSPESRRPEVTAAKDTMGLVLPYSLRPTQGSREVKQYLDARGDRPPGTVAVMLVLR